MYDGTHGSTPISRDTRFSVPVIHNKATHLSQICVIFVKQAAGDAMADILWCFVLHAVAQTIQVRILVKSTVCGSLPWQIVSAF